MVSMNTASITSALIVTTVTDYTIVLRLIVKAALAYYATLIMLP
jgi:hypothetical protein